MALPMEAETAPLTTDSEGVVKVAGTRVTLDTLVYAFRQGASAEEIADRYPLGLADVYASITYYLRHRSDVDDYLAVRERVASKVRLKNKSRFPTQGLRQRLMDRRLE